MGRLPGHIPVATSKATELEIFTVRAEEAAEEEEYEDYCIPCRSACCQDTLEEVVNEIGYDYNAGVEVHGRQVILDGKLENRIAVEDCEYGELSNTFYNDGYYKLSDTYDMYPERAMCRNRLTFKEFPEGLPELAEEVRAYKETSQNARSAMPDWREKFADRLEYYRKLSEKHVT